MKRVNFRLFALAIALVATSCVKDVVVDSNFHGTPSEKICFGAELKDTGEDTRAASRNRVGKHDLKSADGEFVLPMGVYVEDGIGCADAAETRGALFTNAGAINEFTVWAKHKVGDNVSAYFNGVVFEKDTTDNNIFKSTDEEYMWPGDGELTFVAVTNAPDSGFVPNYTEGSDSEPMLESFTYTVPTDATKQNDIVLAKATCVGNLDASAPLMFEHIMSAVNVKIGSVVPGEIRSITFKNVYNKGNYLVDQGIWVVDKTYVGDFTVMMENGKFVSTGNDASGTLVNNVKDATFMMIPQNPGENAEMVIEFYDSKTGHTYADGDSDTEHNALRGSIAGDNWDKARTTNYMLSIDQSFTLTIEPVGKKLDAHYVIGYANVTVKDIDNWTITATTTDGSEVTIQPEEEVNPLAKQGFWTDYEVDANGNKIADSSKETGRNGYKTARGQSTWAGSGDVSNKLFYVFIPENITGSDREISITLRGTGSSTATSTKVILQKYPNWTGDIGWEVVDDDEKGKYGFTWNRKVVYEHKYGWKPPTFLTPNGTGRWYNRQSSSAYANSLISQYSAGAFANTGFFQKSEGGAITGEERMYIHIDYTKLNNLTEATSSTLGYENTLALFNVGGSAASMAFETAIITAEKSAEDSSEDRPAFRQVASVTDKETGITYSTNDAQLNDLSGILTYILKKNRYYLYKEGGTTQTNHAIFNISDLKWYLPAYNEFPKDVDFTPENIDDEASHYWSSTAAEGATHAHRGGDDVAISRETLLEVIAARKNEKNISPATISEIDTEEMKGGENGEAQWVE